MTPAEIDYVNAHGTGTPLNDSAEAAAINRWAGPRAATLPVSSTKAGIGHLLGAAGAVEAVVCLMALAGAMAAARNHSRNPRSGLQLPDRAANRRTRRLNVVLSNSFGFGGVNATLILRRWA